MRVNRSEMRVNLFRHAPSWSAGRYSAVGTLLNSSATAAYWAATAFESCGHRVNCFGERVSWSGAALNCVGTVVNSFGNGDNCLATEASCLGTRRVGSGQRRVPSVRRNVRARGAPLERGWTPMRPKPEQLLRPSRSRDGARTSQGMHAVSCVAAQQVRAGGPHGRASISELSNSRFLHILNAKMTLRVNKQFIPTASRRGGERRKACTRA
jgi:hypothetical protein